MQTLSADNEILKHYDGVIGELASKFGEEHGFVGVNVDVSVVGGTFIQLAVGDTELVISPEQAADLMRELRRAIVKTKPRALRAKK